MTTIAERETNLCNATDTLAQFYDEIGSFMSILSGKMKRLDYPAREEKLRSGTFGIRNLPRRLLASAMVVFAKDNGIEDAAEDDEADPDLDDDGVEPPKASTGELTITSDLKIPFVSLFLFSPKTIPSVRTLDSPKLLLGALGNMRFVEKKDPKQPGNPDSPSLTVSNLSQFKVSPDSKVGDKKRVGCRPKELRRYLLEATLVGFESRRLLEIDTEEKIGEIAEKLAKI